MARERGVAAEMEERLFSAYFSEGRNIEDRETLAALSSEVGMVAAEVRLALAGSVYGEAVEAEMREAEELGADGVPFFVFNRAYAVAGAQPSELFLEVLEKIREGAGAESRPR
jgi:predicted DsbA family dithiol-disulfide isomerase